MDKRDYKIYAARTDKRAVEAAEIEQYHRIAPKYALTLSLKAPEGFIEVKPEEYHRISESEREWLTECFKDILERAMEEHREEAERAGAEFLKRLTRELEKEKAAMKGEANG